MIHAADNHAYIESLWVSDEELAPIIREIDASGASHARRNRRKYDRRIYRVDGGIQFEVRPAGESPIHYIVRPYDLCEQGAGMLHGGVIAPGTQAAVTLISAAGERVTIEGAVSHCRRVRGRIHYIGISFDETIAIERFCVPSGDHPQAMRQPQTYDGVKLVALARELIQMIESRAPMFQIKAKLAAMERQVETGLVLNTQAIRAAWGASAAKKNETPTDDPAHRPDSD